MAFDVKCYELAELFIADADTTDAERKARELAQVIQDAIEDFIAETDPTPNEADLRGPGRDEWKHEAAEWKRLK